MPELPEVETIANDLRSAGVVGKTLTRARVYWPRSIAAPSPPDFCRRMEQKTVVSIGRRGKFLVFGFADGDSLLIHLRMSGRLHWVAAGSDRLPHEHVVLSFADGSDLRFHDTRKFGRLYLLPRAGAILTGWDRSLLEPAFLPANLATMMRGLRRMVKPLLLDQTFIAGLGNIYVDEALWEAQIHPRRLSDSLSAAEVRALHGAIRRVLRRGIKNLGTSLGTGKANFYSVGRRRGRNRDQLKVFRRTGEACPRCAAKIKRIIVGQRGTHICPHCQKEQG
jgi:formamidopyrimidine-DNA glycosylase